MANMYTIEEEYLESFIDSYNLEIKREKKLEEMKKEMNGNWSVEEILEAMNIIYQSIDKT